MYYHLMETTNPATNLATEYYLFKKWNQNGLILWRNSDCIVIGKNQNAFNELNMHYIMDNDINVVRRKSGGGAVFHDLGNINFTFIHKNTNINSIDFDFFIDPVIETLKELGINAKKSGRNDILIDGKKISGNAQFREDNDTLHHGTLMYFVTTSKLLQALNVDEHKIHSKGISSVKQRTNNIIDHLENKIPTIDFLKKLEMTILSNYENVEQYFLTKDDIVEIKKLEENIFSSDMWVYGNKYEYNFHSKKYIINVGLIEINMQINKDGIVEKLVIQGDFFALEPLENFINHFIGISHNIKSFRNIIEHADISKYFYNISKYELLKLFF